MDTHLRLTSQKDYLEGDNRHIIATDTQRNTVYVLAKKHGIKTPEEFGLLVCSHFLYTYRHVEEVKVKIEEYPWERLQADQQPHNHAFMFEPSAIRFAVVSQKRNGKYLGLINSFFYRNIKTMYKIKRSVIYFFKSKYNHRIY